MRDNLFVGTYPVRNVNAKPCRIRQLIAGRLSRKVTRVLAIARWRLRVSVAEMRESRVSRFPTDKDMK